MHAADTHAARMRAFHCLDHQQRAAAIRRLAATGLSDSSIARATALSVGMICRLLAEGAGSAAENGAPTYLDPHPNSAAYRASYAVLRCGQLRRRLIQ